MELHHTTKVAGGQLIPLSVTPKGLLWSAIGKFEFRGGTGMGTAIPAIADGWHGGFSTFSATIEGLFERTQTAYHAFDDLPRLVDEMRLLSVNTELASARAGDRGRAVRVLTQFATQSVSRLLGVVPQMIELKRRSYALAGRIMRAAAEVGQIEAAGVRVLRAGHHFPEDDPLKVLDFARMRRLAVLAEAVAALEKAHAALVDAVSTARAVMMETEIIAANIAIEATNAGEFEAEIEALAADLRGRGNALRSMVDEAGRRLRDAADTNLALHRFAEGKGF